MLGKKLKGLFWTTGDDADEGPEPAPPSAPRPVARAPRPEPVRAADPAVVSAPATSRDFSAVYARAGAPPDPRIDQVLAAFEAMRGAIAGPELAIAIGATARALGLETTVIAEALDQRRAALEAAIADDHRKVAARETARNAELETATATATAEIAALEQKVQTLRQQLTTATAQIGEKNAKERAAMVALTREITGEAQRLAAIRDFFAAPHR